MTASLSVNHFRTSNQEPPMKNFALTILIFCTGAAAAESPAKTEVQETRRRFEIVAAAGNVLYEITELARVSDAQSATYLLVRDEGHGECVMRHVWSFVDQTVTYRISDVKDRAFVQTSFTMPFQSKTRLDTMAEARRKDEATVNPAILKLETNSGRWDGVETEWEEHSRIRGLRRSLRQTVDFSLLEAIERMRGTIFGTVDGDPFFQLLARYVVYDSGSDSLQTGLTSRHAAPDCDFDASLGFPCTTKQKERVEKANKSGKPLQHY